MTRKINMSPEPSPAACAGHRRRRCRPVEFHRAGRAPAAMARHLHAAGPTAPGPTRRPTHSQPAIQQLGAGPVAHRQLHGGRRDGTNSQTVTVTIHGTNDVPVIGGGRPAGDRGRACAPAPSPQRRADHRRRRPARPSSTAQASAAGSNGYGTFTLAANGAGPTRSTAPRSRSSAPASRSPTASRRSPVDGTASQVVTVTIHGTNDVPVIRRDHRRRDRGGCHHRGPDAPAARSPSATSMPASPSFIRRKPARPAARLRHLHARRQRRLDLHANNSQAIQHSASASRSPTASPRSPPTAPPARSSPSPSTASTTRR